ncbi:hypothetical protein ACFQE1_09205 [Halobium palmae]|uniref:Major facilitator superfamily (MFS) profile domain-containing protein n=1 Tax=Halobium palmae TaxID=1776492 RepID=A0ABD5RZ69_9EURY
MSRFRRFVVVLVAGDVLAVLVGAAVSTVGVDPLLAFGLALLAAPVVAYWLVYRTGLFD